ncbi:MAG: M23 family metallopeptidase, partial [Romboutsia sp.]|nr:M23 family metallopeptidase [Romboutsia sp.]
MTLKNTENQKIDLELLEKIATNIKIIQNEDDFNFKDFINNNEINTVATELEGEYYNGGKYKFFIVFYKVELVKGIYQILSQRNEFSPIFNLSYAYGRDLKGDIFGYYSSYQNCFYKYSKSYYIEDKLNFNDIEVIKYFDLLENINKEVNKRISDSVNEDIKNLKKNIETYESVYKANGCPRTQDVDACTGSINAFGWRYPMAMGCVTSEYTGFNTRTDWSGGGGHHAIDLDCVGEWTNVYAAANGTIARIAFYSCGGNAVYINHNVNGRRYTSVYMHLIKVADGMYVGRTVTDNTIIGYVGGYSTSVDHGGYDYCTSGAHLHFGIA